MAIKIEGTVEMEAPNLNNTISSFKELKQQIKAAKDELASLEAGSAEYNRVAMKVGALNDQMKDLNETISQTSGAPMENLNSSFNILGSQIRNLDLAGAEQSFGTLWSTIAANPLTALAGALLVVYQNWDSIKEVLGLTTPEIKDNTAALKEQEEQLKKVQTEQAAYIQQLNDQLELLALTDAPLGEVLSVIRTRTAAQVSAIDQEIDKTKEKIAAINEADRLAEQGIRTTKFASEAEKIAAQQQQAIAKSANELRKGLLEEELTRLERLQLSRDLALARGTKAEEDAAKSSEKNVETQIAATQTWLEYMDELMNGEMAKEFLYGPLYGPAPEDVQTRADENLNIQTEAQRKLVETAAAAEAQILKDKENAAARAAYIEQNAAKSAFALNELVYQAKVGGLQKGSAEEQKAAKQAFELNKGLQLAVATNDGVKSVVGAFATGNSQGGPILGAAYALAAGVVATAQILKIKNSRFTPSTSNASASSSSGSISAGTPTVPNPAPLPQAPITNLNPNGTVQGSNTKVWVSAQDIKQGVNEVEVLEQRASF